MKILANYQCLWCNQRELNWLNKAIALNVCIDFIELHRYISWLKQWIMIESEFVIFFWGSPIFRISFH